MAKIMIAIEIGGRQSEDVDDAQWAVQNIIKPKLGGYNSAHMICMSDSQYDDMIESSEWYEKL